MSLPVSLYSDNGDNFIVIGHRGASAYYPENTLGAFKAAYDMGAEMIELDILLSKDGIPVAIHDETLDRTTNGTGKVVDYTFEELAKLDAGSWFGKKHSSERILSLEEVLQFAKGKIALNIEIKTEAVADELKNGIEEKAYELVKKFDMLDHVLFSSFDYRAVAHLKELDVNIAAALLYEKEQSDGMGPKQLVNAYKVDAFNCNYRLFTKKWADETSEADIPVFVYTVNSERRMKKMIKKGVNGIFTDKPDLLKQVVDNMWKSKGD
ncbi:glycerophosphodiester phosphodiesterase [Rhodohalobacter sp.]|uniref:glycerophosphodiester phosphodiesterase n=1 Tax=Rhodohalobacter sp. TaxID=1974210 RepID=UPI002ACE915C|nr:glycerophosphodiester phosphodiesterase family protein [Rhodohalobacter sp.]MDZ7756391.1 glycerophosphodiester phosphodiesterase family protein [Rhodohalobacter sp.]